MTAHIKRDSCQPITGILNIIYTWNKDSAADHYCFKKPTLNRRKKKIFSWIIFTLSLKLLWTKTSLNPISAVSSKQPNNSYSMKNDQTRLDGTSVPVNPQGSALSSETEICSAVCSGNSFSELSVKPYLRLLQEIENHRLQTEASWVQS